MEATMSDVLEKYKGKHPEMLIAMTALLKGRLESDGAAWYTKEDSRRFADQFNVEMNGIGALYRQVEEYLGVVIDRRGHRPDQMLMLIELLKQTDGVWTDEVRDLFFEKYPEYKSGKGIGPLIGGARRRLGIAVEPTNRPPREAPLPKVAALEEANIQFGQYLKKLRRKEQIEQELEQLKKEIEVYAPIARVMEAMKNAVKDVRDAEERIK
jgi:hypothetical protein